MESDQGTTLEILLALIPQLSDPQQRQNLVAEALELSLQQFQHRREEYAVQSWNTVVNYLPAAEISYWLARARQVGQNWGLELVLMPFVPYLAPAERECIVAQVLRRAQTAFGIDGQEKCSRRLQSVAPHLPDSLWPQAISIVSRLQYSAASEAITALATYAPIAQLPELRRITETFSTEFYCRAQALAALATRYTGDEKMQILQLAVADICFSESNWAGEAAWRLLLPQIINLPTPERLALWQTLLPQLARRTRQHLLIDLAMLPPLLQSLGGDSALLQTYHAIQDVCTWWP